MNLTNENIRIFSESKLSEEKYNLAMQYICHERNFIYTFSEYYNLKTFPLFYMDRYIGWSYSVGGEPIIPKANGFSDFLDAYVREYSFITKTNLYQELQQLFLAGYRVTADVWLEHTDGTPYTTSILLEGMDENQMIYYTKINVTINKTCVPMTFEELENNISLNDEGKIKLTIIKHSDEIVNLTEMNPLQAFKYIFKDLYKYSFIDNQLYKNQQMIPYDLSGFDQLIEYLKNSIDEIITDSGVPKHHEIRLSRHIENKLSPIQTCLKYILETKELNKQLPAELIQKTEQAMVMLSQKLKSLLKFASLLIQRPEASFYHMYVKAVQELRSFLPEYQNVHNNVLITLVQTK